MSFRHVYLMAIVSILAGCGGGGGSSSPAAPNPAPTPPAPPANITPTATAASYDTTDIAPLQAALEGADADGDPLTFAIATQPSRGTLSDFDPATGAFTYTPNALENGLDSFTFTAADAESESETATVSVEIFGWLGSQQFGTAEEDIALTGGLVMMDDGGMVFGGSTDADFDGMGFGGESDAWVRKLTRRGEVAWTYVARDTEAGGTRNVLPHPSGDGFFINITKSPDTTSLRDQAEIVRLDDDGIELWREPVDFGAVTDFVYAGYWAVVGNEGDVYLMSWVDDARALLLTRVDGSDGSTIWNRRYNPSDIDPGTPLIADSLYIRVRGLNVNSGGNLIVTGAFEPDGGRNCSPCSFIAAFDTAGNSLWVQEIQSLDIGACGFMESIFVTRVSEASDGSLLINGASELSSTGAQAGVLLNYSADGATQNWAYCDVLSESAERSSYFADVLETEDGDFLTYGSIVFDDDPGTGLPIEDIILIKVDAEGDEVFRTEIRELRIEGSPAAQRGGSIAVDDQGAIFITGSIDGELSDGAALGDFDGFIRRVDSDGTPR